MAAVTISGVNSTLLPPTITGPIFAKATEASAVQQLARRIPLPINANTAIPIPMDVPTADWVAEAGVKVTGGESVGVKIMTGKKLALLLPVSDEVVMSNPAGLYDQIEQDLPTALARAFDHAAVVGKSLRTGNAGPFNDNLAETANHIVLGTASQGTGSHYADLVNGVSKVVNNNYDFNGFVADPRLKPLLLLDTDTTGRPLWVDNPQQGGDTGTLLGYPAAYGRGVSGLYRRGNSVVQIVTVTGSPTGGSFTLTIAGATATIPEGSTAAATQVLLRALSVAAVTGILVTGSTGGPYTVTFTNEAGAGPITANGALLTGGTAPGVTVTYPTTVDSGIRAIGGDWSQAAYGVGMDITVKISNQASYVDAGGTTHSAFQENLTLLLIEAYYGFVLGDSNAFVVYATS